ncbi:MAG: twin-arginine translocation signal domain-containing protein [Deltaproteobacteria bacterium]|nr:twin-arginine translocation signal domain-containing protein [Deltaproteobacteria bacterium]
MGTFSRRQFLKIAGAGAAAAAVGSGLSTRWWGLDPDPIPDPGTEGDRVVPTFCELCFWKCGVLAHVRDGVVTKLTGNPDHPLSRGRLCPRGAGGTGLLYDPDRLKRPLIRVEKRGEQQFREATWEEALDFTAEKMLAVRREHGPEALALFLHGFGGSWFKHLVKAYGSLNISAPSYAQCRGPREVGFYTTFGSIIGSPERTDLENSRCITLIGSHLGENMHNTQVQELADALARGAGLVVVDPRFSVAASKATHWLPIKPGSDIALLLAWIHVILKEGLYDADYLAKHAVGLDELKKHVSDKTPEWAWTHTTIPPEKIVETARFIAGARPASVIHPGRRVTWYGDDTQRARAMAILNALLGSWGRKGGICIPSSMDIPEYPYTAYAHKPKAPADMPKGSSYPMADEVLSSGVCDATIPGTSEYDIRAWLVYGTNLVKSLPSPARVQEAIQALDFLAVVDVLPVEIAGWADVVLPECTYLERCDDVYAATYKVPFLAVRQPVVEPMFDSKPGWWIAQEIGRRIGLSDYFPWKDSTEYAMHRVHAAGYDCDDLRRTGVIVGKAPPAFEEDGLELTFGTPSGKIELYSGQLRDAGFDPLPVYTPPEEPPPGMFRMLFGRAPSHSFGRTINNRLLCEVFAENEVWVNDRICAEQGLTDGDRIMLVNQDDARSGPVRVKATRRIRPDCVYLVHGWGTKEKGLTHAYGKGASDSDLVTRFKTDPIMGGTGMNVNFVRLERV